MYENTIPSLEELQKDFTKKQLKAIRRFFHNVNWWSAHLYSKGISSEFILDFWERSRK